MKNHLSEASLCCSISQTLDFEAAGRASFPSTTTPLPLLGYSLISPSPSHLTQSPFEDGQLLQAEEPRARSSILPPYLSLVELYDAADRALLLFLSQYLRWALRRLAALQIHISIAIEFYRTTLERMRLSELVSSRGKMGGEVEEGREGG